MNSGGGPSWALAVLLSTMVVFIVFFSTGHVGTQQQQGGLRHDSTKNDHDGYLDPGLYINFHHELIVPEAVNEDWMSFDIDRANKYFTDKEMETLPEFGKYIECDTSKLPQYCCLGAFSMAGVMNWDEHVCPHADYLRFPAAHNGLGYTAYRSIADLLDELGDGKTVTFVGDSVSSQHAHAMECAWLRMEAGRTTNYTRVDYNRIFSSKGGFNASAKYGTNAFTKWEVEVPPRPQAGQTKPTHHKFNYYLMYRAQTDLKEMVRVMEETDLLVLNFGLHYLMFEKEAFIAEMKALFRLIKLFASIPGKMVVWRETSAQFFLSEGGEYPPNRPGLGVTKEEFEVQQMVCHPVRFGRHIPPQWRDRLILDIAKDTGMDISFLGTYNHSKEALAAAARPRYLQQVEVVAETAAGESRSSSSVTTEHPANNEEKAFLEGVDSPLFSLGKTQLPVLYWLPFFRLSTETMHLRPNNFFQKRYDCTHHCYTPYLWEPLTDGLVTVLQREKLRDEGGPR